MSKEHDHIERLTPDLIRRYQAGELSTREQHAVEKYLLENPFEAEALEGLEMISVEEAEVHMEALHNRIDQKIKPSVIDKGATEFWAYTRRIAAAILLLLVAGVAYVWLRPALDDAPMSRELTVKDKPEASLDSASNGKVKKEEEPLEEKQDDELVEQESLQANISAAAIRTEETPSEEYVAEDLDLRETMTAQVEEPDVSLDGLKGWADSLIVTDLQKTQQYQARQRLAEEQANAQRAQEAQRKSIGLAGTNSRAFSRPMPAAESKISSNQSLQNDSLELNQSQAMAFATQRKSEVNIDSAMRTKTVANQSRSDLDAFSISGNVVAKDNGLALPEVTIMGKGTTIGVPTDANGNFTLRSTVSFDSVVVRYLGYLTQTFYVQNGRTFNIELEPDNQVLGEVVVTGYAGQSKKKISANPTASSTFETYVSENLIYPATARQASVKGRVILEVEISAEGKAKVLKTLRGLGYGCDEEATRLVEAWTGWKAKVDKKTGKAIASTQRVKVRFKP